MISYESKQASLRTRSAVGEYTMCKIHPGERRLKGGTGLNEVSSENDWLRGENDGHPY
jgi:hypothetical protein